ncbi:uncharacterized protein LOC131845376, partial [Achroia grisella]|uniref:uncharacterized protein LOC131845376 n=1 Tax=Achroia grisella TaxID=688607 RepID=UPI0027D28993
MSLQRTPPKFSSNPDISASSASVTDKSNINLRKRKQPHDETSNIFCELEKKFSDQLNIWNKRIDEGIMETISAAVKSCMSLELAKISTTLSEINTSILGLQADNVSVKESVSNFITRLSDMETSLNAVHQRQDLLEQRLSAIEINNKSLNQSPDQIKALETKINYMEQQARECNIEISNIPERRNENLMVIATNLGSYVTTYLLHAVSRRESILNNYQYQGDITDNEIIDNRYHVYRCDRDRVATDRRDGGGVLVAVLRELAAVPCMPLPATSYSYRSPPPIVDYVLLEMRL